MRDPKRIDKMILLLKEIWLVNPDLRMGQLMDNLSSYAEVQDKIPIFYLEDDKMEKIMLDYINGRCVIASYSIKESYKEVIKKIDKANYSETDISTY